jgi:hypothetical protein
MLYNTNQTLFDYEVFRGLYSFKVLDELVSKVIAQDLEAILQIVLFCLHLF